MSRSRILWFCLLLGGFPVWLMGQEVPDSRPVLQINSLRQNDFTFYTNTNLRLSESFGKYSFDLNLHHDNIYNTSLDNSRFVQLYFKSFLKQNYVLSKQISLTSHLENDHYVNSDNEKVSLYGGITFRPMESLEVIPLAGISLDRRNGVVDVGFSPAFHLRSNHQFDNSLSMDAGAYVRYKFINPRQQRNINVYQFWAKEFAENTRIIVGLKGGSHELDDYQGTTDSLGFFRPSTVKRIISDSINPILRMDYQFGKGVVWQSENQFLLFRRSFRYKGLTSEIPGENDLFFSGMEVLSRQGIAVQSDWLTFRGSYEFQVVNRGYDLKNTTEQNQLDFENNLSRERQKDFRKRQHKTDLKLVMRPGKSQSLDLSLTNIYLQYDTPSEDNFDDRDELSYIGALGWNSRWRRNFTTNLTLSGNYRHYAFLFAEKSQDNYVQRSLRMDFNYAWDVMDRLRLEGSNAVYVTYNVKDFTDFNRTDRSTRNLETNLKGIYQPIRNLESKFLLYRKETHQSYLNWEKFTETTLDTNRIITLEQRNRYTFRVKNKGVSLYADLGYKHFNQAKKFKTAMLDQSSILQPIVLRQLNTQSGPIVAFGYRDKRQSSIEATLWLQFQTQRNRWFEQDEIGALGITYTYAQLSRVDREVRPYFTLNFNYFFK